MMLLLAIAALLVAHDARIKLAEQKRLNVTLAEKFADIAEKLAKCLNKQEPS